MLSLRWEPAPIVRDRHMTMKAASLRRLLSYNKGITLKLLQNAMNVRLTVKAQTHFRVSSADTISSD